MRRGTRSRPGFCRAATARGSRTPARHEYESLARMLKLVLSRMDKALERPPFNLIIHSAPLSEEVSEDYHWHVEIMPKLTRTAGFESGTGFYINPTSPEEAARCSRDRGFRLSGSGFGGSRLGLGSGLRINQMRFSRCWRSASASGARGAERAGAVLGTLLGMGAVAVRYAKSRSPFRPPRHGARLRPERQCGTLNVRLVGGNNSVVECDLAKVKSRVQSRFPLQFLSRGGPSPRSARYATWGRPPTPLRVLACGSVGCAASDRFDDDRSPPRLVERC